MALRTGIPVLTILVAAGCGGSEAARPSPEPAAPRAVRTAEVTSLATAGASAPAAVFARSGAVLVARQPGAVLALPFREGDRFAAGTVLVRLDARGIGAARTAAEADLRLAEADRARMESLRAKGAATPREAEQAGVRAEAARAALLAAREAMAYAQLRAPFAGRVAARRVNVGDVVTPGTPLVEIEGTDGFEVRASLNPREAAAFGPGARIEVSVDGVEQAVPATVRSLSAAADPLTHRFELRADLAAVPGLRSGLFARLALPAAPGDRRLVVPAPSVFSRGGLTGVYVLADGRARLRWIAAGATTAGSTEVRAGLQAGERVILDASGLEDGSPAVEAR
jgi:RND family efflux transporter MFP subunit